MRKLIAISMVSFALLCSGATRQEIVDHLQSVAVTIRAESDYSRSEGSGICKTVNFGGTQRTVIVTAAHVVDSLMEKKQTVGKDGKPATKTKPPPPRLRPPRAIRRRNSCCPARRPPGPSIGEGSVSTFW